MDGRASFIPASRARVLSVNARFRQLWEALALASVLVRRRLHVFRVLSFDLAADLGPKFCTDFGAAAHRVPHNVGHDRCELLFQSWRGACSLRGSFVFL